MRSFALLPCFAILAACFDPSIDAQIHGDGPSGHWDLYPAHCTAGPLGVQSVDLPGGGAAPNVRVLQATDTTITVTGPAPAAPVVLHAAQCTTFDVDMHLFEHHGDRDSPSFDSIDGNVTFDCTLDGNHYTGTASFKDCL